MNKFLYILLLLLVAASCEIPFKLDDVSEPAIYIQYLPCSGAEYGMKLGYATPAFAKDGQGKRPFDVSDVTVTVDGVKAEVEEIDPDEAWNMHVLSLSGLPELRPGMAVGLSVKGRGVPDVSSSTTIPEAPVIKSVEMKPEVVDSVAVIKVTVKLDRPVEQGEYYGIKAYQRSMTVTASGEDLLHLQMDTLITVSSFTPGQIASYSDLNSLDLDSYTSVTYQNGFLDVSMFSGSAMTLLGQRQFDGDSYTFYTDALDSFSSYEGIFDGIGGIDFSGDYEWPDEDDPDGEEEEPYYPPIYIVTDFTQAYRFEIYRLTDEFYNYAKAQYLSTFNMLSNFGVTPPNFTYSNIDGGLGILAGISVTSTAWLDAPKTEE
ncbi:MAG: DUF4249 family protein [Bacteroidales bacterium]|nr:DUF4249 family protein [Bacteroidales bacterium]